MPVFATHICFVKWLENAAAGAPSRVTALRFSPPLFCLEDLPAAQRDGSE